MTKNKKLQSWSKKAAALCQPDSIYWCDGSQEENDRLCEELVQKGTFVRLDPEKRQGVTSRVPILPMSHALKTERLSVLKRHSKQDRQTTGTIPMK